MKQLIKNGYVLLEAEEGMVLHKVGEGYGPKDAPRRATVPTVDAAAGYEEITAEEYAARRLDEYKRREYKNRLSAAVHERYGLDDEVALVANLNAPMLLDDEEKAQEVAAEWEAYQAYRAECKARVRAEVEEIQAVPEILS